MCVNGRPRHPLALPVRRRGVVPQAREVGRERQDPLALALVELTAVFGVLALAFPLRVLELPQAGVPFRLQDIGDQPVARIHLPVALPREVGFLARPLHLPGAPGLGLVSALRQFRLHPQRDLERHRRHALHQQGADGPVDAGAGNALADRSGMGDSLSLAQVVRNQTALPCVVADRHAAAAGTAHREALQQGRALPRPAVAP